MSVSFRDIITNFNKQFAFLESNIANDMRNNSFAIVALMQRVKTLEAALEAKFPGEGWVPSTAEPRTEDLPASSEAE